MDRGRVLAAGPPDAVLAAPAVVSAYIGTDDRAAHRSGTRPTTAPAATGPAATGPPAAGPAPGGAGSDARPPAGPSVDSPSS
jgi:hypothetical protein